MSGKKIRMKPGVYRALKTDPPLGLKEKHGAESQGGKREVNLQEHIFAVTGSNNFFDLRGVVIEAPVSLMSTLSRGSHVADSWHINYDHIELRNGPLP